MTTPKASMVCADTWVGGTTNGPIVYRCNRRMGALGHGLRRHRAGPFFQAARLLTVRWSWSADTSEDEG